MISRFFKLLLLVLFIGGASVISCAQLPPDTFPDASSRSPDDRRRQDNPKGVREMLAKQQAEREKKEHQEMLERGEHALRLAKQLEASYAQTGGLSSQDMDRLAALERTVEKIRKELGGGDDEGDDKTAEVSADEEPKVQDVAGAFQYLQKTTIKLVDELKKTTRFTISAIAIQTSNSVLKVVRFLRLKK